MKIAYSFLVISLISASAALADNNSAAPSGKEHPCKKIESACEAAGFKKGGHKNGNKGLFVDCMKPIMSGQSVSGVTVDSNDVQACKANKEKWKEKREERHEQK